MHVMLSVDHNPKRSESDKKIKQLRAQKSRILHYVTPARGFVFFQVNKHFEMEFFAFDEFIMQSPAEHCGSFRERER